MSDETMASVRARLLASGALLDAENNTMATAQLPEWPGRAPVIDMAVLSTHDALGAARKGLLAPIEFSVTGLPAPIQF